MDASMIFLNPESGANRNIPNIGLAYAATHFRVRVIDLNTRPRPRKRFLKVESDVLGISVQSRCWNEARRIGRVYKERYPRAQVKSISGFLDVQCCYPYLEFEDKIAYREPFSDAYPFPDYELFDSFSIFRRKWQKGTWSYAIMTSQGCPFPCSYCVSRKTKWKTRTAENCFAELKRAKEKWKIKSFEILDDCFNVEKERVLKFCELVKPLHLNWFCTNGLRADRFDEETAKALAASGCRHISFGIESAVPEVLKAINKGETIEQIARAVEITKKYFSGVNGFFIIGLPGSSYDKDLYSLNWAEEMGINAHFSFYVPLTEGNAQDLLFYGQDAKPVSNVYPKDEQAKIYRMTRAMRRQR